MIRKKMLTNKTIIKKLCKLEAEHASSELPFIAFIGKLPDGRYEVVEHVGIGKGKGNVNFRSLQRVKRTLNNKEEYFATKPNWVVIHGEEDLVDVLKGVLNDDYSKIQIENEGMIENENRD